MNLVFIDFPSFILVSPKNVNVKSLKEVFNSLNLGHISKHIANPSLVYIDSVLINLVPDFNLTRYMYTFSSPEKKNTGVLYK
jgi:hypothetical protein